MLATVVVVRPVLVGAVVVEMEVVGLAVVSAVIRLEVVVGRAVVAPWSLDSAFSEFAQPATTRQKATLSKNRRVPSANWSRVFINDYLAQHAPPMPEPTPMMPIPTPKATAKKHRIAQRFCILCFKSR
ncbi:MAG: hypothetical protein KTU85_01210 [Acidimicrobiia bacterium]|nr:hypothetical protein [Acidimicrobiia bacterium]